MITQLQKRMSIVNKHKLTELTFNEKTEVNGGCNCICCIMTTNKNGFTCGPISLGQIPDAEICKTLCAAKISFTSNVMPGEYLGCY